MGAFFTNIHLRADDPAKVLEHLRPLVRNTGVLVSPEHYGWVTVYPEATEDQGDTLESLTRSLSRRLESVAYATLVHDSSVFIYFLYENGSRLDQYNSRPDYFGLAPEEEKAAFLGHSSVLHRFCIRGVWTWEVGNIRR